MYYREVYEGDRFIGVVGQEDNGVIHVRPKISEYEETINAVVKPIQIDESFIENNISVSQVRVIPRSDPDWIRFLNYDLPNDYSVGNLNKTSLSVFKIMGIEKSG